MSVDLGSEFMKVAIVKPGVPMEIALNKYVQLSSIYNLSKTAKGVPPARIMSGKGGEERYALIPSRGTPPGYRFDQGTLPSYSPDQGYPMPLNSTSARTTW